MNTSISYIVPYHSRDLREGTQHSIYYKVAGEVVKVYAVLDNRRNP